MQGSEGLVEQGEDLRGLVVQEAQEDSGGRSELLRVARRSLRGSVSSWWLWRLVCQAC